MLIYLGNGERWYGNTPVPMQQRRAWEFQAVLAGKIGLTLPEGPQPMGSARLWISPPGHSHGWMGLKDKRVEVAVFHFLSVPELLSHRLPAKGYFEIPLSRGNVDQIRELAAEVGRYWQRPAPGMMICYEHALMALSLIVCEAIASRDGEGAESYQQTRVNAAIVWYAQRMEENPGLPEVAKAAGVSTAHLRRLFHEVLQASPTQIMDQLRFQRATQLMSDPAMKLETIGYQCGFTSASAFSRAFKAKFGCPPQVWRGV